jgi:hypothetical protein
MGTGYQGKAAAAAALVAISGASRTPAQKASAGRREVLKEVAAALAGVKNGESSSPVLG